MTMDRKHSGLLVAGVLFLLLVAMGLSILGEVAAQQDTQVIRVTIDQRSVKADISTGLGVLVRYSGNVTMTGGKANGLTLDVLIVNEEWEVKINPSGYIPVAGDTVVAFDGTAAVPASAAEKTYQLKVKATVDTPGVYPPAVYTDTMDINVIQNRVHVEVMPPATLQVESSNVSQVYVFSFKVINRGSTEDSFSFDITEGLNLRKDGWLVDLLGTTEDAVLPDGFVYVNLNITIPAYAPVGSYAISLQARSGKTDSSSQATAFVKVVAPIPVGTPHSHSWSFLGLGYVAWSIITIAVVGVFMMVVIGGTEVGYFAFLIWVFVPLYCRIMKEKVLDNFTRGEIYGYIKANPGAHYMELQGQLDVPNGVLAHHLMVLEREEFIRVYRDGFYKRFYPKHVKVIRKEKLLSRLQKQVLTEVENHPGISQKTLASYLEESKQIVSYHVKVLQKAGLVRVEKEGSLTKVYAIKGARVVEEVLPDEKEVSEEVVVVEASPAGAGGSEMDRSKGGHGGVFGRL